MPKKHKVKEDVREFCGYDFLLKLIENERNPMFQCLIATLFETGGRISEVLELRKGDFIDRDENYIEVRIPVYKRYRKIGRVPDETKKSGFRWITEKVTDDFRTIPIMKDSPLLPYIQNYLGTLKNNEKLFPFRRETAFRRLRELGRRIDENLELYPHWFRAQKASQLASEYEFNVYDLKEFFKWISDSTPQFYASLGTKGLAKKMMSRK